MGRRPSLQPHYLRSLIKGMSHKVHGMSLLINHNCRKLTLDPDHTASGKSASKKTLSIYVSHGPQSTALLLKETINLFKLTSLDQRESGKNTQTKMFVLEFILNVNLF